MADPSQIANQFWAGLFIVSLSGALFGALIGKLSSGLRR